MARDRQRAKQRKARRAHAERTDGPRSSDREPVDESRRPLHRENVPGSVEHTGEVDEFEAALVAGAGGEPAEPEARDVDAADAEPPVTDPDAPDPAPVGDPLTTRSDVIAGREPEGEAAAAAALGRPREDERRSAIARFPGFLRASWGELQRVQWPDRRHVGQATAVVLGFVVLAGAFLGLADFVAEKLVDWII